MIPVERFIIRVYGILVDEARGILVADEFQSGLRFTKFPGGGLEPGEGTIDGLKREWIEELDQQIEIVEHIYTTDYFQPSVFNPADQLISIYYRVKALQPLKITVSQNSFDYREEKDGAISFRWINLKEFSEDVLTFPIDKLVGKMIREKAWVIL